jgi:Fe2+ or Zn2+ uptake regulation protein
LSVLESCQKPIDALALAKKLKNSSPDTVTVYRVLHSLLDAGIVKGASISKNASSYELADRPHHHHLVCESCGRIEDVCLPCDNLIPTASFKKIIRHELEFIGLCNNCA